MLLSHHPQLLPPRSHRETTHKPTHPFSFRKNVEHQTRYSLDNANVPIQEKYHLAINEVAMQIEGIERDLGEIEAREYPPEEEAK